MPRGDEYFGVGSTVIRCMFEANDDEDAFADIRVAVVAGPVFAVEFKVEVSALLSGSVAVGVCGVDFPSSVEVDTSDTLMWMVLEREEAGELKPIFSVSVDLIPWTLEDDGFELASAPPFSCRGCCFCFCFCCCCCCCCSLSELDNMLWVGLILCCGGDCLANENLENSFSLDIPFDAEESRVPVWVAVDVDVPALAVVVVVELVAVPAGVFFFTLVLVTAMFPASLPVDTCFVRLTPSETLFWWAAEGVQCSGYDIYGTLWLSLCV